MEPPTWHNCGSGRFVLRLRLGAASESTKNRQICRFHSSDLGLWSWVGQICRFFVLCAAPTPARGLREACARPARGLCTGRRRLTRPQPIVATVKSWRGRRQCVRAPCKTRSNFSLFRLPLYWCCFYQLRVPARTTFARTDLKDFTTCLVTAAPARFTQLPSATWR